VSWNNITPSWCLTPCEECGDFHSEDFTCEEWAKRKAQQEEEKDDE